MLGEILAVSAVAGIGLTVIDHENLLGNNPQKLFWWERPPFVPAVPGARASQTMPQIQSRLSPAQELQQARMGTVYADQVLASVSRKYPSLAVQSKYALSSQPQQPDLVYRSKTYP